MIRRPPTSTRTDPLFPDPTLVRSVVAPWVILVLLALRPEGADAYASPEGVGLILAGGVVSVVAFRLMLRIGRLPEPRRWFGRSEEHTSELQSLMRISYAVFCLKKKKRKKNLNAK